MWSFVRVVLFFVGLEGWVGSLVTKKKRCASCFVFCGPFLEVTWKKVEKVARIELASRKSGSKKERGLVLSCVVAGLVLCCVVLLLVLCVGR